MVVPVGDPSLSLCLARIQGSRSRGRRGGQSLCVSLTLASCRTFYSAKGAGRAFQSFDGTFPKNDPFSLPLGLPPSPIKSPFLFIQTAIFLPTMSFLARARITAVAAAPSSPFRPSIFRAPPPRPPFRGDRGSEAVRRAWFYGSAPSLESWREVGDTVFNSVPAGGTTAVGRGRREGCLTLELLPYTFCPLVRKGRLSFFRSFMASAVGLQLKFADNEFPLFFEFQVSAPCD